MSEEMSFVDKMKNYFNEVVNKLEAIRTQLSKTIGENEEMLDAYEKLNKETEEGIDSYKTYGEEETPGLQEALASICDALHKENEERVEMVHEMKHQFIGPLKELLEEWKSKNTEIREHKKAQKKFEKIEKKLEKVKDKPEAKRKPNELKDKEAEYQKAKEQMDKEQNDVIDATLNFNKKKVETVDSALKNMLSIRIEFHKNCLAVLEQVQPKLDAVDPEAENDVVIDLPTEE
ncbi:MAG: hypothetical protein GF364_18855 [Candidatus Lokiarchaeota archaeon]|nr:hypothetical protein [Candidatus Lokiarchaeota archaeon]